VLVDRLLLEPAGPVAAFRERAGLARMTLRDVIG
jgi:hypothetical protein